VGIRFELPRDNFSVVPSGRHTFHYRITEGLPVTRPQSSRAPPAESSASACRILPIHIHLFRLSRPAIDGETLPRVTLHCHQ
jgi:hypothetical protein